MGGGGGTQGPLAEVVVTGRRNVIISLRVFDRAHGGNGGGAGSGGNTRAMRDKPREVVSDQACANIDVARARAAYGALATAMGFVGMRAGQTFVARTTEVGGVAGYNETYIVVNTVVSPHAALVTTECPGGGG